MMDRSQIETLLAAAAAARQAAYAPYSGYRVGAAVLAADGRIIVGCNVENASYGLTICAERAAAVAAVVGGGLPLRGVAVVAAGSPAPCGACRQFLAELGPGIDVLLADPGSLEAWRRTTLRDLLPDQFGPESLEKG